MGNHEAVGGIIRTPIVVLVFSNFHKYTLPFPTCRYFHTMPYWFVCTYNQIRHQPSFVLFCVLHSPIFHNHFLFIFMQCSILWYENNQKENIYWHMYKCILTLLHDLCLMCTSWFMFCYSDGLVQDCGNSIANALELPQSCTKPSNDHLSVFTAELPILTHWGRVMHICVGNLTIYGSDNGLLPDRHQSII